MSILISRTVSRARPCLQPLLQTSRISSRQFSTGPTSPLGARLANSVAMSSTVKSNYNLRNTTNITSDKSYLGYLVAAIVSCIASWLFGFKTAKAEESISEVLSDEIPGMTAADRAAIAQKHGEMWECIGRTPDEFGGYVYHYKLKKEFDFETLKLRGYDRTEDVNGDDELDRVENSSEEKLDKIFPSIEPGGLDEVSAMIGFLSKGRFKKLGYSIKHDNTGVYLGLPDKEALEARFEKIRELHPGLKPLKILSAEGIYDDLTFIEAYLKYDVILSEFVHDHYAHILPTLNLMLSYPDEYPAERDRLRGIIVNVLCRLIIAKQLTGKDCLNDLKNQLPKITTALGIATDALWAIPFFGLLEDLNHDSFDETLFGIIENSDYRRFWKKKFGEKFDRDTFAPYWKQVKNLENHLTEEPKIQAAERQRINP